MLTLTGTLRRWREYGSYKVEIRMLIEKGVPRFEKIRSAVFFVAAQVLRPVLFVRRTLADYEVTRSEDSGLSAYSSALLGTAMSQSLRLFNSSKSCMLKCFKDASNFSYAIAPLDSCL